MSNTIYRFGKGIDTGMFDATLVGGKGAKLAEMGALGTSFAKEWELFDLEADPKEMNNVYADPGYAEIVTEMTAELDRLQAIVGDVGLH